MMDRREGIGGRNGGAERGGLAAGDVGDLFPVGYRWKELLDPLENQVTQPFHLHLGKGRACELYKGRGKTVSIGTVRP